MFGRKVKLKWQGEEHELTITMDGVVEELDNELNILSVAIELDKGGIPKVTLVSKVYAILLKHAGASVTKEDVYSSIMSNPADSAELVSAARYAIGLCFPEIDEGIKGDSKKK